MDDICFHGEPQPGKAVYDALPETSFWLWLSGKVRLVWRVRGEIRLKA
jgi:hypothetical protein